MKWNTLLTVSLIFVSAAYLWAARFSYVRSKRDARSPGRGTLLFNAVVSPLALIAFQFVILRSLVGVETGPLGSPAELLVTISLILNLTLSAQFLGVASRTRDGQPLVPRQEPNDPPHA